MDWSTTREREKKKEKGGEGRDLGGLDESGINRVDPLSDDIGNHKRSTDLVLRRKHLSGVDDGDVHETGSLGHVDDTNTGVYQGPGDDFRDRGCRTCGFRPVTSIRQRVTVGSGCQLELVRGTVRRTEDGGFMTDVCVDRGPRRVHTCEGRIRTSTGTYVCTEVE